MKPFFKNFNAQKEQILMKRCFNKLAPYVRRLPQLSELTLTSVPNSFVRCKICYGKGFTFIRNRQLLTMDKVICPFCNGKREVSTRESAYDK